MSEKKQNSMTFPTADLSKSFTIRPDHIIQSPANEKFKTWKSLTTSKGIKSESAFLLSGEKIIQEFFENLNTSTEFTTKFKISAVIIPNDSENKNAYLNSILNQFSKLNSNLNSTSNLTSNLTSNSNLNTNLVLNNQQNAPKYSNLNIFFLASTLFKELDVIGTHGPLIVVNFPEFSNWNSENYLSPEIITPTGDPKNLGSILRTCDAFGLRTVVLTPDSCHPFLPQSIKSSSLSALRIHFLKASNDSLSCYQTNEKIPLIVMDAHGTNILEFQWPKDFRLLIGEEGRGIAPLLKQMKLENNKLAVQTVSIPTQNVESLNVSTATAIALFHRISKIPVRK